MLKMMDDIHSEHFEFIYPLYISITSLLCHFAFPLGLFQTTVVLRKQIGVCYVDTN